MRAACAATPIAWSRMATSRSSSPEDARGRRVGARTHRRGRGARARRAAVLADVRRRRGRAADLSREPGLRRRARLAGRVRRYARAAVRPRPAANDRVRPPAPAVRARVARAHAGQRRIGGAAQGRRSAGALRAAHPALRRLGGAIAARPLRRREGRRGSCARAGSPISRSDWRPCDGIAIPSSANPAR